jgi:hypothetical protein
MDCRRFQIFIDFKSLSHVFMEIARAFHEYNVLAIKYLYVYSTTYHSTQSSAGVLRGMIIH